MLLVLPERASISIVFSLCLRVSPQVAQLPAAPHRGPDHLPAGLSRVGQAVSLAAHHVSLMFPSWLQIRGVFLFVEKWCVIFCPEQQEGRRGVWEWGADREISRLNKSQKLIFLVVTSELLQLRRSRCYWSCLLCDNAHKSNTRLFFLHYYNTRTNLCFHPLFRF